MKIVVKGTGKYDTPSTSPLVSYKNKIFIINVPEHEANDKMQRNGVFEKIGDVIKQYSGRVETPNGYKAFRVETTVGKFLKYSDGSALAVKQF